MSEKGSFLSKMGKTIEMKSQLQMILSLRKIPLLSFSIFFLHFHTLLSNGVLT